MADEQGRFQLKGFTPGSYAIVYQPAGASPVIPIDTYIKPLLAVDKSIAPLLRNMELGKLEPFADRAWGRDLTLLKGHTFWSEGEFMKIWNATVRRGQQGPYMEVRRGALRVDRLEFLRGRRGRGAEQAVARQSRSLVGCGSPGRRYRPTPAMRPPRPLCWQGFECCQWR